MESDSDNESVFEGFPAVGRLPDLAEDVPDNLSDISVSDVGSEDYANLDDVNVADPAGPEEVHVPTQFSDNFRHVTINDFLLDVGPHHHLEEDEAEMDYFELLFRPRLFTLMVTETNRYAAQQQALAGRADPNWTETNLDEMKAYVGINIWMGIHILPQTHMYWSTDDFIGVPGIIKTMSRDRFNKITQYLHVSDNTYQRRRGERGYDPLYKVREVMEILNLTFRRHYHPHKEMSIDEAMVAFKGRSFLKQYLPNKPIKWGFKVWTLADSHNGYVLQFQPYTGKRATPSVNGLGYDVVTDLSAFYLEKNHHLFFDNLFSSLPLMDHLSANGTYACATFRKNRKGIPDAVKKPGKLAEGVSVKLQRDDLVVCVWHDKKDVYIMSTQSDAVDDQVVRKNKQGVQRMVNCPASIKTYNQYMGGVDLADQKRSYYPVGRESKKFWRYLFWYMLNTALINSHILYTDSHLPPRKAKAKHLEFRMRVARQLIGGYTNRKRKATNLPDAAPLIQIVNLPGHQLEKIVAKRRKRTCANCRTLKRKTAGGRTPETSYQCGLCAVALCKEVCHVEYHTRNSR